MPRPSLATPIIVCVLVAVATFLTFSVAGSPSTSAPATAPGIEGKAAPSEDVHVPGLIIGDGMTERSAGLLSRTFPGWTIDGDAGRRMDRLVPVLRRYKADRAVPPVVVVALGSGEHSGPRHLRQYAVDMLPARTTVVFVHRTPRGSAAFARVLERAVADSARTSATGRP